MKKKYFKKTIFLTLALLISCVSFSQIIADGSYKIFNSVNTEVMTTETGDDYEAFMASPNDTDNYQLWTFTHQGNDIYKIVNNGSGNTLGINDSWCGNFGDVKANFNSSDLNVEFKISQSAVANNYTIEIAFTTCNFGSVNNPIKAFDIQDGSSGGQIQTYEVNPSNPNQQFQILEPSALSINDFNHQTGVTSSYNKNNRMLTLNVANNNISNITVFNLNGKLVNTYNFINKNKASLDFKLSANSLYFIKINLNDKQIVKKVLIH
ncbi:putative secreted protein (Por secretion system target) [Lacinutrix venerupis]|uniref:T9SS type A sorting domain-containing protein n=1 Tax=Lacinutrix venerupis TaxID=1486034 RepID=UPI000EB4B8E9|nr:T9SS type A sorting domain-containing protein [Lacinutrix venerupis]RLJ67375.1 putative secreted protein (Por secretion system target) [Lacinutrix venerupis]